MAQSQPNDSSRGESLAASPTAFVEPSGDLSQVDTRDFPAKVLTQTESQQTSANQANADGSTERSANWPCIAGYELLAELGRGGMGIVYKARQRSLNRLVALKVMRTDRVTPPDQSARFEREMHALARLDHPHLVRIYEIGQYEGQPFYTMPFLSGGNLAAQRQRLLGDQTLTLTLMEKIARAVQYAHEQGVLHRDLKPSNVLLDEQGEPRVSDFGLAKLCDAELELTQTGAVMGTPPYMAPEVIAGRTRQVGPSVDIWSLGVMLYELLIGRRPFVGESGEEVRQRILREDVPSPRSLRPELDPALERILVGCLEKDPAYRYQTAAALADDLARYLRGERLPTRPEPWRRRLSRGAHRYSLKATALFLGASAIAVAAFVAYNPDREPVQPNTNGVAREQAVLIGETGGPKKAFSWIFGEKDATSGVNLDGTFSLSTKKAAALQLADAPPWPSFQLDAEIRHEEAGPGCDIGVYFARKDLQTANGLYHTFFLARFADQGKNSPGRVSLRFSRFLSRSPHSTFSAADGGMSLEFPAASKSAPDKPWRRLKLLVTSNEVRGYWDEIPIGSVGREDLLRSAGNLCHDLDVKGDFHCDGGMGIFVFGGSASFRHVHVSPWKAPSP